MNKYKTKKIAILLSFVLIFLLSYSCLTLANNFKKDMFFFGFVLDGYPITNKKLLNIQNQTKLHGSFINFFLQWPDENKIKKYDFPTKSLNAIFDYGAVACITWEPMYYKNNKEIMVSYKSILNGVYDNYIKDFAKKAKNFNKKILIRFAHEMNISRYHWGTDKNTYNSNSPKIYKKMFKHVVSIFKKEKADNVLWVFCPNAESVPNISYDPSAFWNKIYSYYPGNDYVDILGMDGYNWGLTQTKEVNGWKSHWRSFKQIFNNAFKTLKFISKNKPIFVFETSSAYIGGNKLHWIKNAIDTSKKWGINGIFWFQVKKEIDWQINSNCSNKYINIISQVTTISQKWIDLK